MFPLLLLLLLLLLLPKVPWLMKQLENVYDKVKFVNLSLSTLRIFSRSVKNFGEMLALSEFDTQDSKFIKRKIMNICIRTSYHIFCKRDR